MKLAFMSSVCPRMSLADLIRAAQAHGYQGVELRPEWKHEHGVELDAAPSRRRELAAMVSGSPVEVCCLSPGVRFCGSQPAERDAEFDKLRRYIDLAAEAGIRRIRVFGDPLPAGAAGVRSASYQAQAEYLARAAEPAGAAGIKLVLETHGNFRACDAAEVMFRAAWPAALRVNWHLGHCLRHGEDVDEAYRHVKGRVAHVHFSLDEEKVEHSALARQAELLAADGYDGFFSVEVIHPPEWEPVLQRHAAAWKQLVAGIGASPGGGRGV